MPSSPVRHYYLRWPINAPHLDLEVVAGLPNIGGSRHSVPPGAWVRSDLLVGQKPGLRKQFERPVKGSQLPIPNAHDATGLLVILGEVAGFPSLPARLQRTGIVRQSQIPPEVAIVSLGGNSAMAKDAARLAHIPCDVVDVGRAADVLELAKALDPRHEFVAILGDGFEPHTGWLADLGKGASDAPCLGDMNLARAGTTLCRINETPKADDVKVWVVVTTYGRADAAVPCLAALSERTRHPSWGLIWIDDRSSESEYAKILRAEGEVEAPLGALFARPLKNCGYLKAANLGAKLAFGQGADAIVFLNSDVLVTDGWLQAMVRAHLVTGADLVNPGCNSSAMISMPLAGQRGTPFPRLKPGVSYLDVAACLRLIRPRYPAAVTSVGQCLLVTRRAWENHGPFDEAYGRGYGEECALWAKVLGAGGKAVVADDSYVWHESHATHGEGALSAEKAGVERFISEHSRVYNSHVGDMSRWPEKTAHIRSLVWASTPVSLPVQFFAVDLGPWGGAFVLLRLVHELRELGIAAQLGHLKTREHSWTPTYGPLMHRNEADMGPAFCQSSGWERGIFVATHWSTGRIIKQVTSHNEGVIPAAFWQDLEHRFINPDTGRQAISPREFNDYIAIEDRVVNSQWVGDEGQREFGYLGGFERIPVGIDCRLFMPRPERRARSVDRKGKPTKRRLTIIAMWRPQTKRRGHDRLAEVLQTVRKRFGSGVAIELYGWTEGYPKGIVDRHWGQLTQRQVADAVAGADIFIEPSDYHGFGLPGAEAMASGCALVSTQCLGVDAYATHELDALVVPHSDLGKAVCRIVEDEDLRARLQAAGPAAIAKIDWPIVGARWALWLTDLWRRKGKGSDYDVAIAAAEAKAREVLS